MSAKVKKPAAFLDRDGVLIRDHGYVFRPADLDILPGVWEGLRLLRERGYLLILVSNQSGVARGKFGIADVDLFHAALQDELRRHLGFVLDGIYFCPHHPAGSVPPFAVDCHCRKPATGLLEQAGRDFAIDWERSIMVGDKASDIDCALQAGIRGIQVVADQYELHAHPFARIESLAAIGSCLPAVTLPR